MPTLPLYISPSCSNAWHRVNAPGGYERWHFDAEDAASDARIIIGFYDGVTFDPEYVRRYAAYRRRPTRNAPPTAREYPGVYVALIRDGKTILERKLRFPIGAFAGSVERLSVSIGGNSVTQGDAGEYRVRVEDRDNGFDGEFAFVPRVKQAAVEQPSFLREPRAGKHFWIIEAPLCDVSGTFQFADRAREAISFRGLGHHDHQYGSAPIGSGLRRWVRGRVLLEDRAMMFEVSEKSDAASAAQGHLVEMDGRGVHEMREQRWQVGGSSWIAQGVSGPASIACDAIKLSEPRVVATGGGLWLAYKARFADGRVVMALCETASDGRVGWSRRGWAPA